MTQFRRFELISIRGLQKLTMELLEFHEIIVHLSESD